MSTNFPYLVETFLTVRYPQLHARYVYSGWNGDTVGRALLRLDRDVLSRKPTLVVVCLGLNDPEYSPLVEERLIQFKKDLGTLVERLRQAGARVWLISPPSVRDDLGANTRVQRDGQSSVVNLQAIQYNATLELYTAAIRETAEASGSGFVNWYTASLNLRQRVGSTGAWREARLPSPQSHALIAIELLRAWRTEPIEVTIELGWKASAATVAIQGSPPAPAPVETTETGRRTIVLNHVPLPWPVPAAQTGPRSGAETNDMCRFILRIPDPPARDVTLRVGSANGATTVAQTLTPGQLQNGVNLTTAEPLRSVRPIQDLLQAIGTKNYYQYTTWRRQELVPPREPELANAHRQLVAALYAYMTGHEQIIQRLPKSMDVQLILEETVPPDRVPTAPLLGTRPASQPTTRPTTQPSTPPTTQPTTRAD